MDHVLLRSLSSNLNGFPSPLRGTTEQIRRFAQEQGIPADAVSDIGRNGISHHLPVEQGWALPGTVCVGLDTQFATVGEANTFAIPLLAGSDAVLMTGKLWVMVPECVKINLTGALPKGILAKTSRIVCSAICHRK